MLARKGPPRDAASHRERGSVVRERESHLNWLQTRDGHLCTFSAQQEDHPFTRKEAQALIAVSELPPVLDTDSDQARPLASSKYGAQLPLALASLPKSKVQELVVQSSSKDVNV
jgi:hypothetical protein